MKFKLSSLKYLLLLMCAVLCGAAAAKPLSPVQVSIAPLQSPAPGQPVEFEVRASVQADVSNVSIFVSVPPDVNVLSGELHWQGALLRGQEKRLRFTAAAAPGSQDVLLEAHATVYPQAQISAAAYDPAQLAASAVYQWQSGAARAPAQAPQSSARVVRRNAIQVREFRLER